MLPVLESDAVKRRRRHFVSVLIVVLLCGLIGASEILATPPYRVAVDVRAPDALRGKIVDCLTAGLRALEDVKVVVDDPLLSLNIVAVDFEIGYALSVVATQPMRRTQPMMMLGQLLATSSTPDVPTLEAIGRLRPALEAGTLLLGHSLVTGETPRLAAHCQAIVEGFNDNYLEVYRDAGQ